MFEQIQQAIFAIVRGSWLLLYLPNENKGKYSASKNDCDCLTANLRWEENS